MKFGFPSGKLDKLSLSQAIARNLDITSAAIEVTALRYHEFDNIVTAMTPHLKWFGDDGVEASFHAPASYTMWQERYLTYKLRNAPYDHLPVVLHPDTICEYENWEQLEGRVRVENMDLRKSTGITVEQMRGFLKDLPKAKWCFDVGHARQVDPTMALAKDLLQAFADRLAEIHMSVVLPCGKHQPLTPEAADDYRTLFGGNNVQVPVILETILVDNSMRNDLELAKSVFA